MLFTAEGRLIRVRDVEEAVWVLALLVHLAHQRVTFEDVAPINEEVEGVLLGESDALPDNEAELVCSEITRGQIPTHEGKIKDIVD